MKANIYEGLTAILMQELFENGLFDISELATKYGFSEEQEVTLRSIYSQYYEED